MRLGELRISVRVLVVIQMRFKFCVTLAAPVDRPMVLETTALGAAYLGGMKAGFYPEPTSFSNAWELERRFEAKMDEPERQSKYEGWQDAVKRTLSHK